MFARMRKCDMHDGNRGPGREARKRKGRWGMKNRFLLVAAVFLLTAMAGASPAGDSAVLSIVDAAWTHGVGEDRQPRERLERAGPDQPLTLWMKVSCSPGALEMLRIQGKLPIRHKWSYASFGGVLAQGTLNMTDSIALSAGRVELLDLLAAEVRTRGGFDWRTWSTKKNLLRGTWRVRVSYSDGSPVLCGDKECEYWIELGE